MQKLLIFQCIFAACSTFGSLIVSKEYPFPPEMLAKIEGALQQAAARIPEMQEYPIFYSLDQAKGISLWCPPHMPEKDGSGCSMNFSMKSNEVTLTMTKGLSLRFHFQDVLDQLKKIDPNSAQEHLHFGSIFMKKDTSGSHYYCRPQGHEVALSWQCYLFVSETYEGQK